MNDEERLRFECSRCFKVTLVPRTLVEERHLTWDVKCANCDNILPPPKVSPKRVGRTVPNLLQSTTDAIPGHDVLELKGLVLAAVSTMGFGKLISKQEDRLMHAAEQALAEISFKADDLGANAIVGIKMTANNVEGGSLAANSTGVLAYGTAVVVTPKPDRQ